MIHKKADSKQMACSGLSLSSRLLSSVVRATLPVMPPEEPWRAKKYKGKNKRKKHK